VSRGHFRPPQRGPPQRRSVYARSRSNQIPSLRGTGAIFWRHSLQSNAAGSGPPHAHQEQFFGATRCSQMQQVPGLRTHIRSNFFGATRCSQMQQVPGLRTHISSKFSPCRISPSRIRCFAS
jgi:hypothetical protein